MRSHTFFVSPTFLDVRYPKQATVELRLSERLLSETLIIRTRRCSTQLLFLKKMRDLAANKRVTNLKQKKNE